MDQINHDQIHTHPISRIAVYGRKLRPGEVVWDEDVYDSSDGTWRPCPNPGGPIIEGDHVIWIRLKK